MKWPASDCVPRAGQGRPQGHLLQLIKLWVCASGILASISRDFPADVGPVESPIQLILPIQTASASKQRGPGPRMARKMVMTIRILKHQNPVLRN